MATVGPAVNIDVERVDALEYLAMTVAHLKDAGTRSGGHLRATPLLGSVQDKLALGLREGA
jgi:hypothetical protein